MKYAWLIANALIWTVLFLLLYGIFSPNGRKMNYYEHEQEIYYQKFVCFKKCNIMDSARIYYRKYDKAYELRWYYREKIFPFHIPTVEVKQDSVKCDCN